jgi:HK97 family phage prohead protease
VTLSICGYASLFGIVDGAGDVVLPGAFAASIRRRPPSDVRMLFQHDRAEPIGVWTSLSEDARGLFVRGRLSVGSARVRDIAALLCDGAVDGLSIGFRTVAARPRGTAGIRELASIDLWEISLVTFPMLGQARVARPACRSGPDHIFKKARTR